MDGEIQAVGSRLTHEDYLMPCLLGYGDAVEIHWQCSKSSEAAAFLLISVLTQKYSSSFVSWGQHCCSGSLHFCVQTLMLVKRLCFGYFCRC